MEYCWETANLAVEFAIDEVYIHVAIVNGK